MSDWTLEKLDKYLIEQAKEPTCDGCLFEHLVCCHYNQPSLCEAYLEAANTVEALPAEEARR